MIGAGSGGVRAARIAAAHGAKVAIVEEYRIGGTCVIRGCVPKKLLVYGAHFAEDLNDAAMFGWDVPKSVSTGRCCATMCWPRSRGIEGAYTETLTNHDVTIFAERAVLTGANSRPPGERQDITAKTILIATGARPALPEIDGIEHAITSNEVFHLDKLAQADRDRRRRLHRQ